MCRYVYYQAVGSSTISSSPLPWDAPILINRLTVLGVFSIVCELWQYCVVSRSS
ncbi:hypothetical protein BF4535 [Bacteroides fragilis YCH46]|uniref:Uncharacterized protein n=1 Tax=Bacteroides fragilis (strain YCH46) TaxID=295405 RepID=Q64ML5_BACFR|nr:hypothetical protein BF4535 [Bacteroides fragilis YCH46]